MAKVIQPADVRSRLREALELDLIGPGAAHPLSDERLPGWVRPSNWYLAGFLIPRGAPAEQRADADADDDFDPEVAGEGGLGDDSTEERRAAKKGFFPSSMGLSFLVATEVDELEVTVSWGDYRSVKEGADAERSDGAAEIGGRATGPRARTKRLPRRVAVPRRRGGNVCPMKSPCPWCFRPRTMRANTACPARAGWFSTWSPIL